MGKREWYVVQSKPQKEVVVCTQFSKLNDQIECFFPKIRNHLGIRALFPSYLFLKMEMNVENYRMAHYTRGVLKIIGTRENGPISISPEVVSIIKARVDSNGLIDQRKIMKMGKQVRVRKGPLKDLIGTLEKPVSDAGRVQVLFRLLKYPLRAVLGFEELEFV